MFLGLEGDKLLKNKNPGLEIKVEKKKEKAASGNIGKIVAFFHDEDVQKMTDRKKKKKIKDLLAELWAPLEAENYWK